MGEERKPAGVALKPLEGAFVSVETAGSPEAEKRQATLRIAFFGAGCAERAYAARDYIDGLVKADTRTHASGAVEAAHVLDAAAAYLKDTYGHSYGLDHPVDRTRILAALTSSPNQ